MNGGPVLILFAHPALQKSRVNLALAEAVQGLDGVTFHDLYERYPDFHVEVPREQELLARHSTIVFQHPFYWYSCPALVKQWLDLVLEFGWAYGDGGDALAGKCALSAISTGGGRKAYCADGSNHFTIDELLRPFEQTARLCGMHWAPPFVVHGTGRIERDELEGEFAPAYRRLIERLRDGAFDSADFEANDYINTALGVGTGH